jgi:hypothetical protein
MRQLLVLREFLDEAKDERQMPLGRNLEPELSGAHTNGNLSTKREAIQNMARGSLVSFGCPDYRLLRGRVRPAGSGSPGRLSAIEPLNDSTSTRALPFPNASEKRRRLL